MAKEQASTTETQVPELPRRRVVMDVKIQADDAGEAARCLLDVISWLEGLERRGKGAGCALGEQTEVIADARRAASVVLSDDATITPESYRQAEAEWREAQVRA